nr:hypothetical protein [Tanacetum cinerariifolium]
GRGDDVGLIMLLVDFKNAFNLVDRKVMLQGVRIRCPFISRWIELCYFSPARLYYGEHTLLLCQGVQQGDPLGPLLFALVLHPLICILAKGDPRSRLASVFLPNIASPLHGVKLLGGPASVDFDFSSQLVMKRVTKSIELMDVVAKINDPRCELLLLRACAGISKLYFSMRTCSLRFFEHAQCSFDVALRSALSALSLLLDLDLVIGSGGLPHYPLLLEGLVHSNIVTFGLAFNDALNTFNSKMEIDRLCNPSEVAASKLMKKLTDIYFTRVTQTAESTFYLYTRQMALWMSQMEEHASDWLRVVPISGLGQTMNGSLRGIFMVTMMYRVLVLLVLNIGIMWCAVRTLVDIYFRSGISAGKEVDIGLGGGRDKPLRPADMLLYSWDRGMDVCVDLTGSSPLTQTWMVDFVSGRVVIEAAQR